MHPLSVIKHVIVSCIPGIDGIHPKDYEESMNKIGVIVLTDKEAFG